MASETPPKVAAATEENEKIPTSDGMGADADGSPETGTSEDRHDFSDHDTDDDDDNDDEFNGQSLLPGMTDHFSLPKESCLVRSRKKGNSVRVYDPGFSQQVVIEETHDKGKGTKIEVKKMTDVTTGHRMLNIFYAIVASLFSGFLFVFCLQLLLFVVLDLSIESGATTSNPDLHIGNLLGVIFALIMFSHYFAEALVIAGQFISDSYSDHPLARTFILSGNKNGHLIIEWLFAACFLLIPIGVGIVSLLMARDDWWYITSLTWFSLVMVFFGMFCLNVVYYEVGAAFSFVANRSDTDSDYVMNVLKRCVLLQQNRNYSGYITSSGLARNVFSNTEATDSADRSNVYEKSKVVTIPIWTRFTELMPEALFTDLSDAPKEIYTMDDVQDYRPFLTRSSWSLERIFCRPEHSRYITIVRGPGALTRGQLRSSVICSVLSIILIALLVTGFLVWFDAPTEVIIFFLAVVFMVWYPSLKNTWNLIKLGKDLFAVKRAKKRKFARKAMAVSSTGGGVAVEESQIDPEEGNGRARPVPRRDSLTWQSTRKTEESEAVYHITKIERVREATDLLCWITFVFEIGVFFFWPSVALFLIDTNLALFFFSLSIVSNLRWYINVTTAIQETGNMDLVGGKTEHEVWENKARLNDIVVNISANPSYKGWRILLTSLGFSFVAILLSAVGGGTVQSSVEGYTYLPLGDFSYPGASNDMRYPTCTMSGMEGGWGNQSTMLDYAWLAGTAYIPEKVENGTEKVQGELDTWFSASPGIRNEKEMVAAFLAEEDPNGDIAVTFKLVSVPGPLANETTAIILIRGTVNQWDMLADVQLWSAAALMQWLRYIIPIGEIWTPIFGELVKWMNTMASTSLDKVAFYKLTRKFAEALKLNETYSHVQVTGHSLGGGLSLITGAQAHIPAIGLSAPNALISGKSYDPPITEEEINKYGFNIIPNYDIVPKLDDVSDQYQPIRCTSDVNMAFVTCHFATRSLCEIIYTCGSGNRPVFCECVESYGYPEPIAAEGVNYTFAGFCAAEAEKAIAEKANAAAGLRL